MKYRTIVADPPWPITAMRNAKVKAGDHYPTMTLEQIRALPVSDVADAAAHLYLWAVLPLMAEAYEVVTAWGFHADTVLTWCKPGPGIGGGYRGNTEHLIVARRGLSFMNPTCEHCGGRARGARKCGCVNPDWRYRRQPLPDGQTMMLPFRGTASGTWYVAPRGRHSEKPELFMDLIESMSPGPYLELFARRQRLGWDSWGNECRKDVSLEVAS